jgi:hypothetical protein
VIALVFAIVVALIIFSALRSLAGPLAIVVVIGIAIGWLKMHGWIS